MAAAELNRKHFDQRLKQLKAERTTWDTVWKEQRDYFAPDLGVFEGDDKNDGKRRDHYIINGIAQQAVETFGAGMHSGLSSPGREWYKLVLPNVELNQAHSIREWIDDVQQRMMRVFQLSNVYPSLHALYIELGVFGTCAMLVEEHPQNIIHCTPFTIGEYYLGRGRYGRIDTFYREFEKSAIELVQEYGADHVSRQVLDAYKQDRTEQRFPCVHLIEPNDDRIQGLRDAKNKAFRSVTYEVKSAEKEKYLRVSGYDSFPIMYARWFVKGSDTYGTRNPGRIATGDNKQLQIMEEDVLKALDKAINPPIVAPESVLKTGGVNALPGGVTPYNEGGSGNPPVRALYEVRPDVQSVEYKIERIENRINEAFKVNLFQAMSYMPDKTKTATEILEIKEEKLMNIGPVIGNLQPELHKPLIDRTYEIMMRFGLIPPLPEDAPEYIQGMELDVEYTSILALAQKAAETNRIRSTVELAMETVQVFPEIRHKINMPKALDKYNELISGPADILRSDDEYEQLVQQEREQMMQQEAMATAVQGAKSAKDLAGASVEGDNALTQVVNSLGGAQ